jgi:hypothetical protein
MTLLESSTHDQTSRAGLEGKNESYASGVSWAAVIAGAFVAAALSLILFALCGGIGFSAISPWANAGVSASTVSVGAIICLIIVQLLASSMGGYLAGRLRTKWVNIHTHEVYFRDTAHGFLVWAVSLVITVAFLPMALTSVVGGASRVNAGGTAGAYGSQPSSSLDPNAYFIDLLLRPGSSNLGSPNSDQSDGAVHHEFGIIFANALRHGNIPPVDQTYVAQVVAAKTGIAEPDADKRVSEVFAQAQQAADNARKAIAHMLYWTFLALLMGAFSASFAATIGGKQRDSVVVV